MMNDVLVVIGLILVIVALSCIIYRFFQLPTDCQIENLKQFLRYAVMEAEKQLGSKTGQMKLRLVYSMAIDKFPWVASLITFERFSLLVDESLDWFENQLASNKAISDIVKEG